MSASVDLKYGNLHPFDATAGDTPTDWMHAAARGIASTLQDNPDLQPILDAMDDQAKADLVTAIADIIREAQAQDGGDAPAPDQTAAMDN